MYVVTGAAGLIGSNLLAELEKRGIRNNVACDYLGTSDKWNNLAKRDLYDFVQPENLLHYLELHKNQIETIFHLGAISSTDALDGDQIIQHNYRLSMDLFEWCTRHHVRFIYASSAATYGNGEHGFVDTEDQHYMDKLRPMNLYGWSKHVFDKSILQRTSTKFTAMSSHLAPVSNMPQWVGLKFFNVYGPNEHHKGGQSSVVPHFFKQIRDTKKARLFKSYKDGVDDGQQARDFISVHDAVDVMLWFAEHPQAHSGLFNVGTGQARTFQDLASAVFKSMGEAENIEYIDMPERLIKHYQYFTEGNMTKLRNLGYAKEFLSIEQGVEDYVKNYLMKEDCYR